MDCDICGGTGMLGDTLCPRLEKALKRGRSAPMACKTCKWWSRDKDTSRVGTGICSFPGPLRKFPTADSSCGSHEAEGKPANTCSTCKSWASTLEATGFCADPRGPAAHVRLEGGCLHHKPKDGPRKTCGTCKTCKWWSENKSEGAGYCGCREQTLQITTADVVACEHYKAKGCGTCERRTGLCCPIGVVVEAGVCGNYKRRAESVAAKTCETCEHWFRGDHRGFCTKDSTHVETESDWYCSLYKRKAKSRDVNKAKSEAGCQCGRCGWWFYDKEEGCSCCNHDPSPPERFGRGDCPGFKDRDKVRPTVVEPAAKTCRMCKWWEPRGCRTEAIDGRCRHETAPVDKCWYDFGCISYIPDGTVVVDRVGRGEPATPMLRLTFKDISKNVRVVGIESERFPGGISFSGGQIANGKLFVSMSVEPPIPLNVRIELPNGGAHTFPIMATPGLDFLEKAVR